MVKSKSQLGLNSQKGKVINHNIDTFLREKPILIYYHFWLAWIARVL